MSKTLPKGVSVTICSYNGADRLAETLSHLAQQVHAMPLEIILVDNASTDGTREFADQFWKEHGKEGISYASYLQEIPGKSYAQEVAYEKAQYEYLLVCDDDNWLQEDYCQLSFEIMEANPSIGALGGWGEAVFETEKPSWFEGFADLYAAFRQGDSSGDITDSRGCLYGAGMVIRKSHWLQLKESSFDPLLTCRKGDSLSSGGDTEYCYVLQLMGHRIWYDERLFFKHFMTKGRLNMDYVRRLRKAMFESDIPLRPYIDLLRGHDVNKSNYRNRFLGNLIKGFLPNLYHRILGNYMQKEDAKDYFRNLHHLLFHYSLYDEYRKEVNAWHRRFVEMFEPSKT